MRSRLDHTRASRGALLDLAQACVRQSGEPKIAVMRIRLSIMASPSPSALEVSRVKPEPARDFRPDVVAPDLRAGGRSAGASSQLRQQDLRRSNAVRPALRSEVSREVDRRPAFLPIRHHQRSID